MSRTGKQCHSVLFGIVTAGFLVVSSSAVAQFEPTVSAAIIRTDNLTLASGPDKESETILEISPGFDLNHEGQQLEAQVAYRLQAYQYSGRSDNQIFHQLNSSNRVALHPDHFFFEFGADRSQSVRDPRNPIPSGNLFVTNNLLNRDDAYAGPSMVYGIGGNATFASQYLYRKVRYEDTGRLDSAVSPYRQDFDDKSVSVSVDNYRKERGFTWALRYSGDKADYDIGLPFEFRSASAEIGGWVGESLRIFATGGKESAWDMPFDASLEDSFWEAGFSASSGDRLSATLAVGERTFGSSGRASIERQFRRGRTSLSYAETPTTEGRNPYDRGGLLLPRLPDDFLTLPGSMQRYISNRADWQVDFELRRTNLGFSVFDEERVQRTTVDGTPLDDESQTGVTVSMSWELGSQTAIELDASRAERDYDVLGRRDYTRAGITARLGMGTRTDVSLSYDHVEEKSPAAPEAGYTVNMVAVRLERALTRRQ